MGAAAARTTFTVVSVRSHCNFQVVVASLEPLGTWKRRAAKKLPAGELQTGWDAACGALGASVGERNTSAPAPRRFHNG